MGGRGVWGYLKTRPPMTNAWALARGSTNNASSYFFCFFFDIFEHENCPRSEGKKKALLRRALIGHLTPGTLPLHPGVCTGERGQTNSSRKGPLRLAESCFSPPPPESVQNVSAGVLPNVCLHFRTPRGQWDLTA